MFAAAALLLSACGKSDDITNLSRKEVYFFYQQSCPHCHTAADYIKANHPKLRIKALDINMPGNRRLFENAVREYKPEGAAGTPFICFGKRYIMGWGDDDPKLFDELAADYK